MQEGPTEPVKRPPRPAPARPARARGESPDAWRIDLHLEHTYPFAYHYQHLRVERTGRRASVRELSLLLEYDFELRLVTKPRRAVRQRGRSLTVAECEALWREVASCRPERLADVYPCLDDTDPSELDPSLGPDGVPIAVHTGEEGPACLTLRVGKPSVGKPGSADEPQVKRIVVERCRDLVATDGSSIAAAPLARLVALLDPGLQAVPFNYRRTRAFEDLRDEFLALKQLDFLNLRAFERSAIEALGWLRDEQALSVLTPELFAPDPAVRLQALEALHTIGSGLAAGDVELLCYDEDPNVRERAREVLERLRLDAVHE